MADAPILAKSTGDVEEVFAPKLHGLRVLDSLLPDGCLAVMVLFSSSSTLTAPVGQVDYVAANECLNAFARSRVGAATRVIALDWGIWAEAGMAADAMATRLGQTPSTPASPCAQPLYDDIGFDPAGNRRLTLGLRSDHWIVDQHRTRDGAAILPGTGYLDMAAQSPAGPRRNRTVRAARFLLFPRADRARWAARASCAPRWPARLKGMISPCGPMSCKAGPKAMC